LFWSPGLVRNDVQVPSSLRLLPCDVNGALQFLPAPGLARMLARTLSAPVTHDSMLPPPPAKLAVFPVRGLLVRLSGPARAPTPPPVRAELALGVLFATLVVGLREKMPPPQPLLVLL